MSQGTFYHSFIHTKLIRARGCCTGVASGAREEAGATPAPSAPQVCVRARVWRDASSFIHVLTRTTMLRSRGAGSCCSRGRCAPRSSRMSCRRAPASIVGLPSLPTAPRSPPLARYEVPVRSPLILHDTRKFLLEQVLRAFRECGTVYVIEGGQFVWPGMSPTDTRFSLPVICSYPEKLPWRTGVRVGHNWTVTTSTASPVRSVALPPSRLMFSHRTLVLFLLPLVSNTTMKSSYGSGWLGLQRRADNHDARAAAAAIHCVSALDGGRASLDYRAVADSAGARARAVPACLCACVPACLRACVPAHTH